ncbi:hypothetical protein AAEO50_02755 [Rossellomorea oryzaecorticis]|uniref:Uncharacterized protein n=1 Tax=Rossellomorea oryzaecorticis TaxID=1396505 RepID=A0ABU9K521_9BACI
MSIVTGTPVPQDPSRLKQIDTESGAEVTHSKKAGKEAVRERKKLSHSP